MSHIQLPVTEAYLPPQQRNIERALTAPRASLSSLTILLHLVARRTKHAVCNEDVSMPAPAGVVAEEVD